MTQTAGETFLEILCLLSQNIMFFAVKITFGFCRRLELLCISAQSVQIFKQYHMDQLCRTLDLTRTSPLREISK